MIPFANPLARKSPEAVLAGDLDAEERRDDGEIVEAIGKIAADDHDAAAELTGPVGAALRDLAAVLERESGDMLGRTVDFSMQASEAMASVSRLTGDIRDVAANTSTMAAAMEQMAASINQVAESSNDAAQEAVVVENAAREGISEIDRAVDSMRTISAQVQGMVERLAVLEEAAEQISDMAQSIEGISNQTKLLALNATIEAARAGDAGKGFAVVAAEVKALSEQTSKTTDQIRERIDTLNAEMGRMSEAMDKSAALVGEGEGIVNAVGDKIHEMGGKVSGVTLRMNDVAGVLEQQRHATDEVAEKITRNVRATDAAQMRADTVIDSVGSAEKLIDTQFGQLEPKKIHNWVLYRAKSDHLLWKKRLAEMLVGITGLKAEELADHHSCRLGKWYDQVDDPAIRNHPAYSKLVAPHMAVHSHGKAAAAAYARGDRDKAEAEYALMEAASAEVIRLLNALIDG